MADKPLVLKWSEMGWWLSDPAEPLWKILLGEAGNSNYRLEEQVSAMRIGDEVFVQAPCQGKRGVRTIPASTIVKGFGGGLDSKTLREVMEEGLHYCYNLRNLV